MKNRFERACVACAVLATACADAAPTPAADSGGDRLYVLWSGTSGPELETNYFTPIRSLDAGAEVDYARAIEQPGIARLYGEEGVGYFAIGDGESQTITRYDLGPNDRLVPGASLSLQGFGVTLLAEAASIQFVSPTKAYYIDPSALQVLVWNPTAMTIDGAIDLSELAREGAVPSLSFKSVLRGDELILAGGWYDPDFAGVQPGMALVRIDTTSDELSIAFDERCRDPGTIAEAEDGTLLVFSNYTSAIGQLITKRGGLDCVLRVLPDEDRFDPDYLGSMQQALGGRMGVAIVQRDAGHLWALAHDPSVSELGPGSSLADFFGTAAWRWQLVDLPALSLAREDSSREPTVYNSSHFRVDGRLFVSVSSPDFARTTLLDVSGDEAVEGVSFDGFMGHVLRVR
jgi:hypothetical protein